MLKFLYSVMFLCATSWVLFALMLFKLPPNSYFLISLFLLLLLVALTLSLALIISFFKRRTLRESSDPRKTYRTYLKIAFLISFAACGFLFLRAVKLVTVLNTGLFAVFYITLAYQLLSSQKQIKPPSGH